LASRSNHMLSMTLMPPSIDDLRSSNRHFTNGRKSGEINTGTMQKSCHNLAHSLLNITAPIRLDGVESKRVKTPSKSTKRQFDAPCSSARTQAALHVTKQAIPTSLWLRRTNNILQYTHDMPTLSVKRRSVGMYHHITSFITYLKSIGVAHRTQLAYKQDIYQWIMHLNAHHVYTVSDITQEHVDAYMAHLERQHCMRSTAQRKCSALRYFAAFCPLKVQIPRVSNLSDVFCTDATLERVYKHLLSYQNPYTVRDGMIMACIYHLHTPFTHIAQYTKQAVRERGATMYIHGTQAPRNVHNAVRSYIIYHLPQMYGDIPRPDSLLFPYIRNGVPVAMERNVFIRRVKQHIAQCARVPYSHEKTNPEKPHYDKALYRRYTQFHSR